MIDASTPTPTPNPNLQALTLTLTQTCKRYGSTYSRTREAGSLEVGGGEARQPMLPYGTWLVLVVRPWVCAYMAGVCWGE
jgi:hypothetical protein